MKGSERLGEEERVRVSVTTSAVVKKHTGESVWFTRLYVRTGAKAA